MEHRGAHPGRGAETFHWGFYQNDFLLAWRDNHFIAIDADGDVGILFKWLHHQETVESCVLYIFFVGCLLFIILDDN